MTDENENYWVSLRQQVINSNEKWCGLFYHQYRLQAYRESFPVKQRPPQIKLEDLEQMSESGSESSSGELNLVYLDQEKMPESPSSWETYSSLSPPEEFLSPVEVYDTYYQEEENDYDYLDDSDESKEPSTESSDSEAELLASDPRVMLIRHPKPKSPPITGLPENWSDDLSDRTKAQIDQYLSVH